MTPVAEGLFTIDGGPPRLIGSQCAECGVVAFPKQASCQKCTSRDVVERLLARRGTLWSWTVQGFAPKSPPYAGDLDTFEPYGVGYVELPGEVRVEARLSEADPARLLIGMPMELTLIPAPGGGTTYAFRPVVENSRGRRP
jgi:uncharacterized OB-fold protein